MSGKEVIICHDDPDTLKMITLICEQAGLWVLGGTTTFEAAVDLIFGASHLAAIFIDGNLSPTVFDGSEGATLAEYARSRHPGVVVASISGENQPWSDFPHTNYVDTKAQGIVRLVLEKLNSEE